VSAPLGPSPHEGRGVHKSGVYGRSKVRDRLRIIYRTGQDPDTADLNAEPDDWGNGGVQRPPRRPFTTGQPEETD